MEKRQIDCPERNTPRLALFGAINSEAERLKICLLTAVTLGLTAHGYGFLNFTFSDDSLNEFYLSVSAPWKFAIGRFMEPLLRYLMGEIMTLPWLTGLGGLLAAGLAACLMSKMFRLDQVWENVLLAGVLVTNATVTVITATFIHDFCGDMLALLLAVCAARQWQQMKERFSWKHTLLGALCLTASLGFYQTYTAVTITLLCLDTVSDLLQGVRARTAVVRLLKAAPMGALGGAAYFILTALSLRLSGAAFSEAYSVQESQLNDLIQAVKPAYYFVWADLMRPNSGGPYAGEGIQSLTSGMAGVMCLFNGILLLLASASVAGTVKKKKLHPLDAALAAAMILLLPVCMLCVSIVSGWFHHVMRYAVCLYYLFVLMILRQGRRISPVPFWRWGAVLPFVLMAAIVLSNIQIANAAYVKKDLERQATASKMPRILSRLDQYEGYDPEQSQVALIGWKTGEETTVQAGAVDHLSGLSHRSQITYRETLVSYLNIVLQDPIRRCSLEKELEIAGTEEFRNMGVFPARDCIATIDGVVVVKISELVFGDYYDEMNLNFGR